MLVCETLQESTSASPDELRIVNRVRECTANRVQKLRVVLMNGRTRVMGQVGSYYVRQLAEQAVLRMVPGDCVDFAIRVGC